MRWLQIWLQAAGGRPRPAGTGAWSSQARQSQTGSSQCLPRRANAADARAACRPRNEHHHQPPAWATAGHGGSSRIMRSRASEIPAASSHRAHVRACSMCPWDDGGSLDALACCVASGRMRCGCLSPFLSRVPGRSIDPPPPASAALPHRLDRSSTGQTLRRPPPNGDLPLPLPFPQPFAPQIIWHCPPPQTSPRRDPSPPGVSVSPLGFTLLKHLSPLLNGRRRRAATHGRSDA